MIQGCITILNVCIYIIGSNQMNSLKLLNDCICPGNEVTYECTVCGQGATVWTGSSSLFNCRSGEIILRHRAFEEETSGECNLIINRAVVANSVGPGVTDLNNLITCYTSQLHLRNQTYSDGDNITCLHNNGVSESVVDTAMITIPGSYKNQLNIIQHLISTSRFNSSS